MIDPVTASVAVYLVPPFIGFFMRLMKHKQAKKRLRAQRASEYLEAEQERQKKAEEAEAWKIYWRLEAQKAEAWEAKQAEEREATREREREREAKEEQVKQANYHREEDKDGKKEKKRLAKEKEKREAQQEALAKEAKKEKKRQAQLERERVFNEKMRLIDEKIDREKRERKAGEKKAEMNTKFVAQALQYAFRLFTDLLLRQQLRPCSCGMHPCRCNQTLKHQEREKLLAHFELIEGGDDDLLSIFGASNIPLRDNPGNSNARNIALLELPDQLPGGFEEDILSMAMTTINGPGNGQGTTLLELDYQLFDDFEDDDTVSSMTDATQAKEKGNAYFKDQEFEEAIKWYSKSINELPTTAAYGNRAMAYLKLNKFIEAEKDCTEALRMDDRYFKAYARRAIARTKLGCNIDGALVDVKVALELESSNQEMVELYDELMSLKAATEAKEEGNAYFKDQNFKEAIICYSVSINKSPTVVAYSNRAMAYLKLNKFMEAENDCTKALKIDDQYFKAYARRAIARSKLGRNREGALKDVEVALKLEPNNQEMKELHVELNQVLK